MNNKININSNIIKTTKQTSFKGIQEKKNGSKVCRHFVVSLDKIDGYEGTAKLTLESTKGNNEPEKYLIYFQTPKKNEAPFSDKQSFDGDLVIDNVFDSYKNEYLSNTFIEQHSSPKQTPQTKFTATVVENMGYGQYRVKIENIPKEIFINTYGNSTYKNGDTISGSGYLTANFGK